MFNVMCTALPSFWIDFGSTLLTSLNPAASRDWRLWDCVDSTYMFVTKNTCGFIAGGAWGALVVSNLLIVLVLSSLEKHQGLITVMSTLSQNKYKHVIFLLNYWHRTGEWYVWVFKWKKGPEAITSVEKTHSPLPFSLGHWHCLQEETSPVLQYEQSVWDSLSFCFCPWLQPLFVEFHFICVGGSAGLCWEAEVNHPCMSWGWLGRFQLVDNHNEADKGSFQIKMSGLSISRREYFTERRW